MRWLHGRGSKHHTHREDDPALAGAQERLAKARADEPRVAALAHRDRFGPKIRAALSQPQRRHP